MMQFGNSGVPALEHNLSSVSTPAEEGKWVIVRDILLQKKKEISIQVCLL